MIKKLKEKFSNNKSFEEMAKKTAYSFGMRVLGLLVNYLFLYFVNHKYGTKSWGIFALCFSMLSIGSMIGTLGVNVALVKIIAQGYSNLMELYKRIMKFFIPLNLGLNLIVFCFSGLIGKWLSSDGVEISTYIKIASFGILPFSISMINSAIFRANKEIVRFSFYDSLGRFLWGGLSVLVLYFFTNNSYTVISGFVIGLYILSFVSFKGLQKILHKDFSKNKPDITEDSMKITEQYSTMRKILKLSVPLFWSNFIMQGSTWAVTLIIGLYLSKEQVGVFDAINRFASLITIILYAVNSISAPKFAESLYSNTKLERNVQSSSKIIFFTTIPLFIVMLFGAPLIFNLLGFYDAKLPANVNIYFVFCVILLGQLVNNLSGSVITLMQMAGFHVLNKNISLISFIGTTSCLFFVTPLFGLAGAAVIVGLNIAFKNIASVVMIYKKMHILTVYYPRQFASLKMKK